jgi:hypothetical protein
LVILSLAFALLNGCTLTQTTVKETLPPPPCIRSLLHTHSVAGDYLVTVLDRGGTEWSFPLTVEQQGAELSVVGFSPFGNRGLTLRASLASISSEVHRSFELPFSSATLFELLLNACADGAQWGAAMVECGQDATLTAHPLEVRRSTVGGGERFFSTSSRDTAGREVFVVLEPYQVLFIRKEPVEAELEIQLKRQGDSKNHKN